jgi:hypothetical protein
VTLYAGIDPGLTGAVAILDQSKRLVDVFDMPTVGEGKKKIINAVDLAYLIAGYGDPFVTAIEHVHSMPTDGSSSAFKFGMSYGIPLGIVATLGHRTLHPTPNTWKGEMGLTADKERSRKAAIDRWPKNAHWFRLVKDHGKAEAALLALWCYENAGELDVAS